MGRVQGPLGENGLNLFRSENYSLFEVNAEVGMIEKILMSVDLSITRTFKTIRKVCCNVWLVPEEMPLKIDKGWGHARRQSLGDLVCFPLRFVPRCSLLPESRWKLD